MSRARKEQHMRDKEQLEQHEMASIPSERMNLDIDFAEPGGCEQYFFGKINFIILTVFLFSKNYPITKIITGSPTNKSRTEQSRQIHNRKS